MSVMKMVLVLDLNSKYYSEILMNFKMNNLENTSFESRKANG